MLPGVEHLIAECVGHATAELGVVVEVIVAPVVERAAAIRASSTHEANKHRTARADKVNLLHWLREGVAECLDDTRRIGIVGVVNCQRLGTVSIWLDDWRFDAIYAETFFSQREKLDEKFMKINSLEH